MLCVAPEGRWGHGGGGSCGELGQEREALNSGSCGGRCQALLVPAAQKGPHQGRPQ